MHKIVINSERKLDKQEKDSLAIRNVLLLVEKRKELKEEFKSVVNELTKKERKKFNENITKIDIEKEVLELLK